MSTMKAKVAEVITAEKNKKSSRIFLSLKYPYPFSSRFLKTTYPAEQWISILCILLHKCCLACAVQLVHSLISAFIHSFIHQTCIKNMDLTSKISQLFEAVRAIIQPSVLLISGGICSTLPMYCPLIPTVVLSSSDQVSPTAHFLPSVLSFSD